MIKLKEIIEPSIREDISKYKLTSRITSRAVFKENDLVLMIYSKYFDDYSFPGGGVEKDEDIKKAVIREAYEEVGAINTRVNDTFAYIFEYRNYNLDNNEIFMQTSYYSFCEAEDFKEPHLELYEINLGYKAVWIKINDALEHNKNLYKKRKSTALLREIKVLEYLEGL